MTSQVKVGPLLDEIADCNYQKPHMSEMSHHYVAIHLLDRKPDRCYSGF